MKHLGALFILIACLLYGAAFVDDKEARSRDIALRQSLAITPPAGGGRLTLPSDEANDIPALTPRPVPVFTRETLPDQPPPAPSPTPSKNEFHIDDHTRRGLPVSPVVRLAGLALPGPAMAAEGEAAVQPGEVELQFKTGDGRAWAAYVQQRDASVFLRSTLRYIDEHRERTQQKLRADLDAVFKDAFADRDEAIDAFADWYYGYFTSFVLVGKGVWGGVRSAPSGSLGTMQDSMELAVQEAIRRAYLDEVLKPELRDPVIQDGVRQSILDAHNEYRFMIEGLDERLIRFVSDHARYVRPIDAAGDVHLTLDWDSESWRAPLHYDREAVLVGAGGAMVIAGSLVAGDVIADTIAGLLGGIIAESLVAAEATAGGAAIGSGLLPGVGTVIGGAVGAGAHGVITLFRDHLGRDEFIADSNTALDATIATWDNMIAPETDQLVERWFNETKKLVDTPEIESKLGS